MKRFNIKQNKNIENPKIDSFLNEIISVYKKHGLAISHEDEHGAFIIVQEDKVFIDWIMEAFDDAGEQV